MLWASRGPFVWSKQIARLRLRAGSDAATTTHSLYRRVSVAVVVVISIVILTPAASNADDWGHQDGNTGAHPDEGPHTYCYSSSVGSDMRQNVGWIEGGALRHGTQASVIRHSSCNWTGYQETDAVWQNVNLTPGVSGVTPCQSWENGVVQSQCDQYYVKVDMAEVRRGSHDERDESQTICHELGHANGLTHGGASEDCMISTSEPPPALQWRRYGTHHRWHINGWY